MLLFWSLIGALIGVAAAQKKGFHVAAGIIGGLLLGPLAVLMFFVSGTSSRSEKKKKCPDCANLVNDEARICQHCRHEFTGAKEAREREDYLRKVRSAKAKKGSE